MAEQAIELRKGDSRLTSDIVDDRTLWEAGIPSYELWSTFESDQDPGSAWREMIAPESNAAMPFYRDMERKGGVYAHQLAMRKRAVLSKTWRVNPTSSGESVAEFIEDTLWGIRSFEHVLRQMLDALGKGVSIQEIIYAFDGPRLVIEKIKSRPQEAFSFNEPGQPPTGALRLSPTAKAAGDAAGGRAPGASAGPILPANKFIVTTFEMEHENRWGNPLARSCFWPWWFKRQDVKFWLKFIEKGTGTVVANYPSGASDNERQQALQAAISINRSTAVAKSERFAVELLEKARAGGGAGEVFSRLAEDLCDTEITMTIRGQTLTSRGGDRGSGSMALGEVHERQGDLVTESDAKMLMETVQQQIVDPLCVLNFGPDVEPPEFVIDYEREEDLNQSVTRDKTLSTMVEIPKSYIRQKYQLPEPESGEEIVETAPPPAAGPGGAGEPGQRNEFADPSADEGDPEPGVIEREGLKRARGIYARFVAALIERAGKELE